ncbi:uncharacterized protein LOC125946320 [Dermacentor silvarum]|uniref:uncharacterized protein LOC125946320 n=1 Tax=Dermacentor silvarum TaxID=543639 RepID=UPI002100F31C|nr:uncharacterized protein LOC125946320 [Dermacentor silvarum]
MGPCRPAAIRRGTSTAMPARLLLVLLEGSLLLCAAAGAPAEDANFGYAALGILRYRDASGFESLHCAYVSTRFKRPPYGKENDTFREAVFVYANQSCDLGLEKSTAKHVVLMLPVDESPCPFEASFSQAVSAHAYSVLVARNVTVQAPPLGTAPPRCRDRYG